MYVARIDSLEGDSVRFRMEIGNMFHYDVIQVRNKNDYRFGIRESNVWPVVMAIMCHVAARWPVA